MSYWPRFDPFVAIALRCFSLVAENQSMAHRGGGECFVILYGVGALFVPRGGHFSRPVGRTADGRRMNSRVHPKD